ncbi:MAG TPA: carboxylating nicotinate-nucleotide diphosphorylase [Fimbriimonadaceae bacterium]|nr:carboxylating nicotinate-nucleotide diphosphorylase [Fimbriimonadaceae bacterium]
MSAWLQPEPANWWYVVDDAIEEDVGSGDVTGGCVDPSLMVEWYIAAQGDGVLCGVGIAEYLFAPYGSDPEEASLLIHRFDGDRVTRGERIVEGILPARRVLIAERTALNFLMMLSGVASLTAEFVERVSGTGSRIVDTRKTVPGLRSLQKYAVRCGGGANHRMGLFDGAMIKDNHIMAAGGIREAIHAVRSYASHMTKMEVECETLEQVEEAVRAGADIVMLDNMDPFMMREAVKKYKDRVILEASGGISLETVSGVAGTGVDFISVGAITHSAPSLPFHLELA